MTQEISEAMNTKSSTGGFRLPSRRNLLTRIAPLLASALLSSCNPFVHASSYTPQTTATLTTERTTHCLGRYLIDLPSNFELHTGGWGDIELYYGLDKDFETVYATVKPGRYTNEAFWKEVNQRRFELQGATNTATKGPMLLLGEQLDTSTALLRRLGDEFYGLSIKTEVHVLVGNRYVTLEQESYSKDDNDITYTKADPAPAETRLKMIASKLLPYENATRAKPGFCMQGVLFDVGQDDENGTFNFYAKDVPDVHLTMDYHAVTGQPSQGLYERVAEGESSWPMILHGRVVLRRGDRALGGAPAQENLSKQTDPSTQHLFDIERRSTEPRTLDSPFFSISLNTGNEYGEGLAIHRQGNSSLSDAQMLKLWDDMVTSVRKR